MKKKYSLPLVMIIVIALAATAWYVFANRGIHQSPQTVTRQEENIFSNRNAVRQTEADRQTQVSPVKGSPRIDFPEPIHDFGTVILGAKLTHVFIVRNIGDAPLRVIKAKAG